MASPWTWPIVRVGRAIDVGDDADDRDAVEEGLADAGQGVGQSRAGHDGEDADRAGGPRRGVGHDAGRSLVGDQQVGNAAGLERVPELVVLGPGNAEDAAARPGSTAPRPPPGHRSSCPDTPARLVNRPSSTPAGLRVGSERRDGRGRARTAPPATSSSRRFTLGDTFGFPPGQFDVRSIDPPRRADPSARRAPAAQRRTADVFVSARERGGSIATSQRLATLDRDDRSPQLPLQSVQERRGQVARSGPDARRGLRAGKLAGVCRGGADAFEDDRAGVADGIERSAPVGQSIVPWPGGWCESCRPLLSWT